MKKIIIILAVILTSALTAWAVTNNTANKTEDVKTSFIKANAESNASAPTHTTSLATAD